jgi:cobalt/nickel transport system permease protein
MSSTQVSQHIPDINLITYYAEKQETLFSRVSPWTKAFLLVLLILAITISRNLWVILGLYLAVLILFALAQLPVNKLFAWYLLPVLFVISLVGIMAWTQPGTPVISFATAGLPLVLTDQGILLVVILTLKTLISVTFSLFFVMTTRYEHFSGMIYRIFPAPLDQIFLMAYRFLFLTLAMIGSILKAARSRGGGFLRGVTYQSVLFAGIFGLVFIRSFERAERVHKAMIARGYHGSYSTAVKIPNPGIAEYGVLGIAVAALVAALWLAPFTGW